MPVILDVANPDLTPFIQADDTVIWGQANAEPLPLSRALMTQRHLFGGRIRVFLGINASETCLPEHADHVDFVGYGASGTNRNLVRSGVFRVLPCHYSQLSTLLSTGTCRADVLFLQVSEPDEAGRYSFGLAHEYLVPLIESARVVIAEVNRQMPFIHGERMLTAQDFTAILPSDRPLLESRQGTSRPADKTIAGHIAGLVEDGSTLQLGIGAIADSVLAALSGHRDLGYHSGSMTDGVAALMEQGVINNARKTIDQGISTAGVLLGSRYLHDFADNNPAIRLRRSDYTHNGAVLAGIDKLVAINSAIEVDLTGQVNSEVAAGQYVGAVGGALDFIRGAQGAKGGLPIIALPSLAGEHSRIVARLSGPVTIPRSDAGLIVTEYGIADLRGLDLEQRRQKMLAISHPDYRDKLAAMAD